MCIRDSLNNDNEYIRQQKLSKETVTYGVEQKSSDYRAYNIQVSSKGSSFQMTVDSAEYTFQTRLIGVHNVLNIAGAIAAVSYTHLAPPITHKIWSLLATKLKKN